MTNTKKTSIALDAAKYDRHPADDIADKLIDDTLTRYIEILRLKQVFRRGWLINGIPPQNCESIAEHSFGVAWLTLLMIEKHFPELDAQKACMIAMIHDLAEARVGDITPHDAISGQQKRQQEESAIRSLFADMPNSDRYIGLWLEYEDQTSAEAKLVKQLDRFEMAVQALAYEHQQNTQLSSFYDTARQGLTTPQLLELFDQLLAARKPATYRAI